MPYNGSGSYSPPGASFPAVANTLIMSTKFNNVINDIATALSTAITKDGQTTVTANLPMGGYRHTGVGAPSARDSYATVATVQDSTNTYAVAGGTADVLTLTLSPAIIAYAEGQLFGFRASATNATTTPTLNVNGVGAKTVVAQDGSALAAADITSGRLYLVQYYNNNFRLVSINKVPNAGNAGKILRSNGTAWTNSSSTYPDTVAAGQIIRASGANAFAASAATYPDTVANGFLYASSANVVTESPYLTGNLSAVIFSGTWFNSTNQAISGVLQVGGNVTANGSTHVFGGATNTTCCFSVKSQSGSRDAYATVEGTTGGGSDSDSWIGIKGIATGGGTGKWLSIGVDGSDSTYTGGIYSPTSVDTRPSSASFIVAFGGTSMYYPGHGTTASAANLWIDASSPYEIRRSTSSMRYKRDVEPLDAVRRDAVLQLEPIWYRSKATGDRQDWSWYGLSAEAVAEVDPRLVHWYADPEQGGKLVPDGVQYERVAVLLLGKVKEMEQRLKKLEL